VRSQAQSNYIYRAPSSELGLPQPLSRKRVCPLPPAGPKGGGGGHTRLRLRGVGSPISDDWKKSLALCLLCGIKHIVRRISIESSRSQRRKSSTSKQYNYFLTFSIFMNFFAHLDPDPDLANHHQCGRTHKQMYSIELILVLMIFS
jgi:hypothetical protein